MKKAIPLILSISIHAFIILFFLFIAGVFNSDIYKSYTSVSIEGDPNKRIGEGGGMHGMKTSPLNTGHSPGSPSSSASVTDNTTTGDGGGSGSGEGGGTGFGVKETYIGQVLKRIHSHKYYPIYAQKRHLQGVVKLKFTLRKDGTIKSEIKKVASSGLAILDEAGIKTIKDASPYMPFPSNIKEDELDFVVDIDFVLH